MNIKQANIAITERLKDEEGFVSAYVTPCSFYSIPMVNVTVRASNGKAFTKATALNIMPTIETTMEQAEQVYASLIKGMT